MSRINRAPVTDGTVIDATDLNDRYSDFTQTDLNQFNHRDAAHDLPQFSKSGFMLQQAARTAIGNPSWKHATFNSVPATVAPPAFAVVSDAALLPTVLNTGASGWTVTTDDVLRIYWDLTVRPDYELGNTPWLNSGSGCFYTFGDGGAGTVGVNGGGACWAFWLQWDITDNTLTNWVDVPGQDRFNDTVTTLTGTSLDNTQATSVLSAFNETASLPSNGTIPSGKLERRRGWTSVSGAWHYTPPSGTRTVYGVRVVFTGVLRPFNNGGVNYLVYDPPAADSGNTKLDYNAGSINASVLRMK